MDDLISRQAAIDAVGKYLKKDGDVITIADVVDAAVAIGMLPSAEPECNLDEWCHDCKEYDYDKHCCPRWNRVIRTALEEAQPERKKGRWLMGKCSLCGGDAPYYPMSSGYYTSDFCPNCGADMRGGEK